MASIKAFRAAYRDKGGLLITKCYEKMQIVILPKDGVEDTLIEVLQKLLSSK